MAINFTGNTIFGIDATANGDLWITKIQEYVTNVGYGFDFVTFTDVSYAVEGSVYAVPQIDNPFEDGDAVHSETARNNVYVRATGTLWGEDDGVDFDTGADDNVLVNEGSVIGRDDTAVDIFGKRVTVENLGTLEGGKDGIYASGEDVYIYNSGTILGLEDAGIDDLSNGGRVVNHGIINGQVTGVFTESGADGIVILNTGHISGGLVGIQSNTLSADTLVLRNSGTIAAGDPGGRSFLGVSGDETVINEGLMLGNVQLGDGADTYRGVGLGEVDDGIFGETGNDLLVGSDASDKLFGEADNDTLTGGGGADSLFGGGDNDTLRGGEGDDVVNGGAGVDILFGGSGDDEIIGGLNRDIMRGNGGQDVFVFQSVNDSLTTAGNTDVIIGFERGVDVIDLDGLSAGDLTFIGTAGFSGTADELRAVQLANGTMSVQVDTDGDMTADFRLFLRNIDTVDANDFIL
ncbi:MAG: hypothetical protein QNJ44_15840 [Rhodobacter sp.]|nr:hypothetical protein [Rhodobacter sp.]